MIDPQSRSLEWIEQASALIPNIADTALVEKAIRALSLLESLVRSGCPFVFKGGTALMLHLDTSRRLSIDVDIVCPPGLDIQEFLGKYGGEYGFLEAKEIERKSRTGVPKSHAEYRYAVTYPSGRPRPSASGTRSAIMAGYDSIFALHQGGEDMVMISPFSAQNCKKIRLKYR